MAGQIRRWGAVGQLPVPSAPSGKGKRAAPGQGRRAHDANRHSKKNRSLEKAAEKRKFVDNHVGEFGSVAAACRAVGLAPSSYYYREAKKVDRAKLDADIRDRIEAIQAEFPFYGHRRIHEHLERLDGITVNKKKILKIMREHGLKALIWRGFKVKTTDSNHAFGYADNLLPGLELTDVNQAWVTDITYIRIRDGFVYLAAILDLFSRKVVGWAISTNIDRQLCLDALRDAVKKRRPPAGLIHHSDRGVQYACHEYRQFLKDNEIIESMSAQGYCYDNAFMGAPG